MSKRGPKIELILSKTLCLGVIVILVSGGLALSSCNGRSMSSSPMGFGSIHCRSTACASDDFFVSEGDTIEITYDIVIDRCERYAENGRDCGLLSYASINLLGGPFLSSESIWRVEARSSEANAVTITAPQSGLYSVSVNLYDVEGEAQVEWNVQRGFFKNLNPAVIVIGGGIVLGLVLVALGVLMSKMKQAQEHEA